jgi:oxygen-independent coproporphyrinogen III oxidase
MSDSAIYIHIPFCDHKCIYCDFYSIITSDNIIPFLHSLKKEVNYYAAIHSANKLYSSIYFGGGTPSLMDPNFIYEIIHCIKENYSLKEDAEITLETNPGTVDKLKLKDFLSIGINRLSVGIQSFFDEDLKFLTRIHDKETALNTIKYADEAGFANINIDLIFNLPGQTKEKWQHNLETGTSLPVNHISAYSLILERGTILNKMVLDGKVKIQDQDYDAELYELTMNFLEKQGFIQYEVSNFAKPGFECRHNNAYWRYKDYLSFGPSAHSFVNGKRWWNFSSLKRYIAEIERNNHAVSGCENIDRKQKLEEYVMLALRSKGLDIIDFKKNFGEDWLTQKANAFKELVNRHLLEINDYTIRLTKTGYALCDEILNNIL